MFSTLEPLLKACGQLKLILIAGDNGIIKVAVTPERKPGSEPALSQPLFLSGTANELDEGFATAIGSYTVARTSLVEQVEATTTIMKDAEKNQVTKAAKATKPTLRTKPGSATPAPSVDNDDNDDEDDDELASSGGERSVGSDTPETVAQNAPASAPTQSASSAGTDLLSLI